MKTAEKVYIVTGWIFITAVVFAVTIVLAGCGNVSSKGDTLTYAIDGNGSLPPLEQNQTIEPGSNVESVMVNDDGIYVVCSEGSTCTITIGDTDNSVTEIWYQYNGGNECCYSCGGCEENITIPPDVSISSLKMCSDDMSGGEWCTL